MNLKINTSYWLKDELYEIPRGQQHFEYAVNNLNCSSDDNAIQNGYCKLRITQNEFSCDFDSSTFHNKDNLINIIEHQLPDFVDVVVIDKSTDCKIFIPSEKNKIRNFIYFDVGENIMNKDNTVNSSRKITSVRRSIKSSKPGIGGGTVFETEVLMPKAEFNKWKRAVEREGVAYTVEYDFGGIGCYVTRNGLPKHIGTWFPDTEVLACDDISLFGNYIDNSRQIKLGMEFDELTEFSHQIKSERIVCLNPETGKRFTGDFYGNYIEITHVPTNNSDVEVGDVYSWSEILNMGYMDDREHAIRELYKYNNSHQIKSSRKITSARYVATDPESGEVLGSADTYEEAVNEWGEDVTITDSEAAEGQEETEGGLFQSCRPIKSTFPGENSRDEYLRMQGRNMRENQATLTQGEFDDAMDNNGYFIRGFYKWSPDSHNWGCEVDVNLYLVVSYATDGGGVHIYLIDTSSGKKEMIDERYVQSLDYDDVAEECIDIGESIGENFTEFF